MAKSFDLDAYVAGEEPENKKEKKASGMSMIIIWLVLVVFFIASVFIECDWWWTITFGLAVLALFVPAVYFGFAKANICFTVMDEGTIKVITAGGAVTDIFIQWKDHDLNAEGNVISCPEKVQPSFLGLGGIRFYGIWPFRQIYTYKFTWATIDQDGNKKEHKGEILDYALINDALYWIDVEKAEDCNLLPLDIEALVTARIVNPYKALFAGQNWHKIMVGLIQALIRGEVAEKGKNNPDYLQRGYQALVADRHLLGEQLMNDDDVKELFEKQLKEKYGVEIIKMEVKDINPPEKFRELTMRQLIEQQEKAAIEIKADAEAERTKRVYSAVEAQGDTGRLIRTLEMLERSKDKWIVSPDILNAVKNLFNSGNK